MTPFTVEWTSTAEDQLTDIWMQATDPGAVTKATAAIDALLARNPLGHGSAVQEGLRKITIAPLTVYYQVHPTQPLVEVEAAAYTP
jgi:plasmid stabilization system protein ParE